MKKYYWKANCDSGSFDDVSNLLFDTPKDAYNDMRNHALEKMKWNTEYEEDFDDLDNYDYINYAVKFSRNKIIHESYSGTYTWEIKEIENKYNINDTAYIFHNNVLKEVKISDITCTDKDFTICYDVIFSDDKTHCEIIKETALLGKPKYKVGDKVWHFALGNIEQNTIISIGYKDYCGYVYNVGCGMGLYHEEMKECNLFVELMDMVFYIKDMIDNSNLT